MVGKRARVALVSGGLEPVIDGGGGGHSVFAKAFIDALRGNADVLEGQRLFDAIKRPVVLNADQTPVWIDRSGPGSGSLPRHRRIARSHSFRSTSVSVM
jgi:hypothetical protein